MPALLAVQVLQDLTKEVLGLRTSNVELEEDLHDALNREQRMSQEVGLVTRKVYLDRSGSARCMSH